MDHPLTKSQLCWVLLRLCGVSMLYQAVVKLISIIVANSSAPSLKADSAVVTLVFLLGITCLIGFYLLFYGRALHRIIMREPSPILESDETPYGQPVRMMRKGSWMAANRKKEEPEDPQTTLTEQETKDFAAWLNENDAIQNRPLTDQIALFRDFQKKSGNGPS
ncbi:MAG: hypothetical protein P1U58_01710 [Verrucomicrobiales bacterium]|nr:hypothetical protein [Verrucomicrobiales bacterium]